MLEQDRVRYEKIANLLVQQVSGVDIAHAMGMSESAVSQLQQEAEFQEIYQVILQRHLQDKIDMDEGWDAVERLALEHLLERMKYAKDPDFLLKAGLAANKATRRAVSKGNENLPSNLGTRVVINLNQAFITQVQNLGSLQAATRAKVDVQNVAQKQIDMLAPNDVNKMFDVEQAIEPGMFD